MLQYWEPELLDRAKAGLSEHQRQALDCLVDIPDHQTEPDAKRLAAFGFVSHEDYGATKAEAFKIVKEYLADLAIFDIRGLQFHEPQHSSDHIETLTAVKQRLGRYSLGGGSRRAIAGRESIQLRPPSKLDSSSVRNELRNRIVQQIKHLERRFTTKAILTAVNALSGAVYGQLSRMVEEGLIRRLSKGVYELTSHEPTGESWKVQTRDERNRLKRERRKATSSAAKALLSRKYR